VRPKSAIALLSILAFAGGCASTASIEQGKNLSASGIAYSDAVYALIDVSIDKVIDFDSVELRKGRFGEAAVLKQRIEEQNKAVADVVAELASFKAQTAILKAYFVNLQALADSTVKDDAGAAVQALSESIGSLNGAIGNKAAVARAEALKQPLGTLAGLVAQSVQAEKIKRALTRDADVINRFLRLQEIQLENISDILKDRFVATNDLFASEEVNGPYADTKRVLGDEWIANRKLYIKSTFVNQQLDAARQAASQLQGIWADIAQGKADIGSLRIVIADIDGFVGAVQAIEAAGKSK
jgi:hypothetical protein